MYIPVFLPCPDCSSGPYIFTIEEENKIYAQCECDKISVCRSAYTPIPDREEMKELAIMWNCFIKNL